MRQYEMFELKLLGDAPAGSEALVDVEAVFRNGGSSQTFRGFYDGDGVYKVRYLPGRTGTYTWARSAQRARRNVSLRNPMDWYARRTAILFMRMAHAIRRSGRRCMRSFTRNKN